MNSPAHSFQISGNIVDIINERIFPGTLIIGSGKIASVAEDTGIKESQYILPGFIDSHVHIESSMLAPSEFARLASVHGTVAAISDPHEIANVTGMYGVRFMIDNGRQTPFKFYFGAPSCVPATVFETSGAALDTHAVRELLQSDDIKYLSEMMNFPGVLNGSPEVIEKINIAKELGKPVDGHAPGLQGGDLVKYVRTGISTDHECFSLDEAIEKITLGMKILIREGSAARNFETLHPLISMYPEMCMLCSDDKHPDGLAGGHINELVKRALSKGHGLFDTLKAATLNPVRHYNLDTGLLRCGDDADFIVIDNLNEFNIKKTYIKGIKVAENGSPLIDETVKVKPNVFNTSRKTIDDFRIERKKSGNILVIEAIDGELVTNKFITWPNVDDGLIVADIERDILKIAAINRYEDASPALGFVKNFGLKRGAIASSVAHDSHNIIAVGANDKDICTAVNTIIDSKGGIAISVNGKTDLLPLPIAGLMSAADGYETAKKYAEMNLEAKSLGSALESPFMTLSFMALTVIPKIKLSDKGLFDGESFSFIELETD